MSMKLSRLGNDDADQTARLMSASRRLIDEAARLFPLAAAQNERTIWLEAMIDEVPDYLYFKDRNSRFVVANRRSSATTGARGWRASKAFPISTSTPTMSRAASSRPSRRSCARAAPCWTWRS